MKPETRNLKRKPFHNRQERIVLAEAQSSQRMLPKFINALRSLCLCEGDFFILAPDFPGWVFEIEH